MHQVYKGGKVMTFFTQMSFLFFIACTVYIFFSFYIIDLNYKSRLNRIFFMICLSLSVWSFSFSIANSVTDYGTALFWRRISSIGWGTVYSFLLHFVLLLTQRHKILKNRWIHIVLYLPAIVNILVFGIFAQGQYNLFYSAVGWTHILANNFFAWYFNFYFAGFSLISLGFLCTGEENQKTPK